MTEKDCFVMARGAYMVSFNQQEMSMSRSKEKAMAMEQADAEDLASTIAGACVVKVDGSDVMNLPNILDIFRAITSNIDAAKIFKEKLERVPNEVSDGESKIKELCYIVNKLYHRASFDPSIVEFWDENKENPYVQGLMLNIATSKGMMIVSGVDN
jgi:hypothetical protein